MAKSEALQKNPEGRWMIEGMRRAFRTSLRWGAFGVGAGLIVLAVL